MCTAKWAFCLRSLTWHREHIHVAFTDNSSRINVYCAKWGMMMTTIIMTIVIIVIINYNNGKSDSSLRKSWKCDGFLFLVCHVITVLSKAQRPRQKPWAYKLSLPEKSIQISLSYSNIVCNYFLRQRQSPFIHQMFPLWKWNNQHVTSMGQRKNLSPWPDLNLWPPKH